MHAKKNWIWNHVTCTSKTSKYLESSSDDSVITRDGIIEMPSSTSTKITSTKPFPSKNCSNKK